MWIGWLHSARGLSQLTSTFGGAWLMAKDSNWLCVSIAVMQVNTLSLSIPSPPHPPRSLSLESSLSLRPSARTNDSPLVRAPHVDRAERRIHGHVNQ